ncbi:MAG TPA: peptide chain release factor N(5)-glutamine methyltransferase [Acidimicrobiales bacterium]
MAAEGLDAELAERFGSRREAAWVLAELAGLDPDERRRRALELADRRRDGEPLQYLLGHWPFRSLDLVVDARALIPRPETEQLVGLALDELARREGPQVVCDLGCGTGAIALSLALESTQGRVEVHASDVSVDALELARLNAGRLGASVQLHHGAWFAALPHELRGRLDVVCANPPYVSSAERATLARELDFEPEVALVAEAGTLGTPGFGAVEAVLTGAAEWLAPDGVVLVEHGSTHREAVLDCARRAGLVAAVDHDDLAGLPRVLTARRAR